jgi:hypothetical protein
MYSPAKETSTATPSEKNHLRNFLSAFRFALAEYRYGQGMVLDTQFDHNLSRVCSGAYWRGASGQSTNSTIVRQRCDLFACDSVWLVA